MKLEGRVTNPVAVNGYRLSLYALILLASLFLGGCSVLAGAAPTPLPTVVLGSAVTQPAGTTPAPASSSPASSGGVSASGIVVPAQSAQIASVTGGNIQSVNVAAGDQVQAGQVLVKLAGSERLAAAIEAANLELLSAQQALKTLNDNANQARTAAQLRLATAQKALDDAKKQRAYKQYRNGSQSSIDAAYADLILANNRLKTAEDTFKGFADSSQDDINRAAALSALSAARAAHDRALANLNYLLALPSIIEVNLAEARLQSAQAEVDNAQQDYDRLNNGPDPDALALAEEHIKNARAQIAAGQADLASLELKAPFSGTVTQVNLHTGEWAIPGQAILALADLKALRVETTDLSERNVPQVQTGQAVTVFVKALSQDVIGRVSEISALADRLGGDVIYKTIIELDTRPDGLRAGMSVEVTFN